MGEMKPRCTNQRTHALTLVEVVVVIFLLAAMFVLLLPAFAPHHGTRKRIDCVNNLKQIGLSYRIWAGDNNDKYPMEMSVTNGGTLGLADGRNAWINYFVMSNELSTPKVLICPLDISRQPPATNFSTQLSGHVSYFVGLDATANNPQALLSGDDNFEINGAPIKSGLLEVFSNTPLAWTTARHNRSGNLGLADGSVQLLSNASLTNQLRLTGLGTNRLAIP